jgi:hypothetical protein
MKLVKKEKLLIEPYEGEKYSASVYESDNPNEFILISDNGQQKTGFPIHPILPLWEINGEEVVAHYEMTDELKKLCDRYKEHRRTGKIVSLPEDNKFNVDSIADGMYSSTTLTRVEVIDDNGRVYVIHDCKVQLSIQDECRTLKVFVTKKD